MKISVIIPTRSINDYITKENLPGFEKQTYKKFEVIVLPNEHGPDDNSLLKKYPWLKIIPTHKITRPAQKRDIGAKHATGQIIAFIDDDAFPSDNWLEKAVEQFKNKKNIAAICGPGVVPQNAKYWEKVFDAILGTFIGAGGYSYRFTPDTARFVDDYPSMNFLVKKNIFLKVGGFNSDFWPGEDSKLCEDIVYEEKGKIWYSPDVLVYHHRRNSLIAYLKQHGNYGFHRGAFLAHGDKNSRRVSYLIPTLFVVYLISVMIAVLLGRDTQPIFIPLIMYIFGVLYLFLKILISHKSLKIAAGSALVLFLTHAVYGILFMKGFWKGLINKDKIYK